MQFIECNSKNAIHRKKFIECNAFDLMLNMHFTEFISQIAIQCIVCTCMIYKRQSPAYFRWSTVALGSRPAETGRPTLAFIPDLSS